MSRRNVRNSIVPTEKLIARQSRALNLKKSMEIYDLNQAVLCGHNLVFFKEENTALIKGFLLRISFVPVNKSAGKWGFVTVY